MELIIKTVFSPFFFSFFLFLGKIQRDGGEFFFFFSFPHYETGERSQAQERLFLPVDAVKPIIFFSFSPLSLSPTVSFFSGDRREDSLFPPPFFPPFPLPSAVR